MQKEEVQELVEKYLHNIASKEEEERLLQWYWRESNLKSEWELNSYQSELDLKSKIYTKITEQDESETDQYNSEKNKFKKIGDPHYCLNLKI
jgi:hypothetical protein